MAENYNTDELEPPTWMDKQFFERALRSYVHDNGVLVKNFESKPATKVGDHFASIMFRVKIEYDSPKYKKTSEKIQVIVKTMPITEGMKAEFLKDSPAFKIETKMYAKVLPEMERVLRNAGDNILLGPRLIYHFNDPAPVIIMEDISVTGYEMNEKTLDYDGARLVALRIAKFHAASIYLQANGMDLTGFNESFMTAAMPETGQSMLEAFMAPSFDILTEIMSEWEGDWSDIIEKLKKTKLTFPGQVRKIYEGRSERLFSILNHCDFHVKNMMFKKEEGQIKDLLLLDFQFCMWGTCAIDLAYLFYMVGNIDARARRTEMLQEYYTEFESTLKRLGYLGRIPTLHDFNVEILSHGIIEVMLAICIMTLHFMDFSNLKTEEIFDAKDPLALSRLAMRNPEYQKILKIELRRFANLGLIG